MNLAGPTQADSGTHAEAGAAHALREIRPKGLERGAQGGAGGAGRIRRGSLMLLLRQLRPLCFKFRRNAANAAAAAAAAATCIGGADGGGSIIVVVISGGGGGGGGGGVGAGVGTRDGRDGARARVEEVFLQGVEGRLVQLHGGAVVIRRQGQV